MPKRRARRRAPRSRASARARASRAPPDIGLALAGGGPLGGIYEVGALLALADSLDGLDLNDARRLRRRVVGQLRRRRARERHLAGADVPAVHRGRRRRRAQARALPAARVRRVRAAALAALPALVAARRRCSTCATRSTAARWSRSPRSRAPCRPACSTTAPIDAFLVAPVRRAGPHQRLPQAAAQAVPRRDQPRHRRVGDVRRARARPRADLARDRGVERAARPVPAGRDRRRALRRRRAQQDAARVGRARRGRRRCCCASTRWCRSTPARRTRGADA